MTKHYCDKCKKETDQIYPLEILVHITRENPLVGHAKEIGGKWFPVSGRTERIDLCLPCYNKTMAPVWESLKQEVSFT